MKEILTGSKIMKIFIVTTILFLCLYCYADDYDVQTIGDFDYVSGDDGYSGQGHRIGNFYYYTDNRGNTSTTHTICDFDYTSGADDYSGTGQSIGDFYYYNDNYGGNYTAQSIGNFDYTSGSYGYSGTGQQLGNFYYYSDNE